jgi:hypothetical protein
MLYPLPPKDYLTADNLLIAAAIIGTIFIVRLIYTRLTRPALMSGTLSRR